VSQRTRRAFKAFLVRGKDGKTSFEFEPRKEKAPAKGKAAAIVDDTAETTKAAPAKVAKKVAAKKPAAKKAVAKKKPAAKKVAA
jgi:DNA topoisomerase-3